MTGEIKISPANLVGFFMAALKKMLAPKPTPSAMTLVN